MYRNKNFDNKINVSKHFFIISTFISNAKLKLAKNQAKAKQLPKVELLLNENYSRSSSTLLSKNNRTYSKKCTKNKCLNFNEVIRLMTMKTRLKMNIDHTDTK